jgi:hypothetical protein
MLEALGVLTVWVLVVGAMLELVGRAVAGLFDLDQLL